VGNAASSSQWMICQIFGRGVSGTCGFSRRRIGLKQESPAQGCITSVGTRRNEGAAKVAIFRSGAILAACSRRCIVMSVITNHYAGLPCFGSSAHGAKVMEKKKWAPMGSIVSSHTKLEIFTLLTRCAVVSASLRKFLERCERFHPLHQARGRLRSNQFIFP